MRPLSLLALATALLLAAPTLAAAQPLSQEHTSLFAWAPQFDAAGGGLVAWDWQDGLGNGATTGASFAARPAGAAAFGAERPLPAGTILGPAAYGSGRLVVATQRDTTTSSQLRVRFGDFAGRFGPAQLVARRRHLRAGRLAVNARGDAALAWSENFGSSRDRIYVSLRRHGGRFAPPTLLGKGPVRAFSVAVGPQGDVLAAWDARGRIRTRYRPIGRRAFAATDELVSETTYSAALQTAVAADGRAWVAWTAQLLTEGGDSGDVYVQAAMREPRGRRFHRALLLEHSPSWATAAPVSLSIDAHGDAGLAWATWNGGPTYQPGFTTISVARIGVDDKAGVTVLARFAEVEPSSAAQIALRDDGQALATWAQAGTVHAAVAPVGGSFGAPLSLGPGGGAQAVYPPGGGAPLVVLQARGALQTVALPGA